MDNENKIKPSVKTKNGKIKCDKEIKKAKRAMKKKHDSEKK